MNTPLPPDPIPTDLQRWLDEQADGAELARAWQLAGYAAPRRAEEVAVEAAWDRVQARLPAADRQAAPLQPGAQRQHLGARADDRPASRLRRGLSVATGLSVLCVLAVTAVIGWGRQPVTVHADAAAVALTLPDGSSVALAPGSSLTHPRAFRERTVDLVGQAHFEVTPGQPFTVMTFNAEVAVLGTAFDVRAWPAPDVPEAAETDIVVFEGRVALRARGAGDESVELAAHQRARVAGSATQPERMGRADISAADAWRHADFAAYDSPLAGIINQIERQFDTRVRLGPEVDPARRVTALLPQAGSAQAVLADLAVYLGYRLHRRPDGTFDLR